MNGQEVGSSGTFPKYGEVMRNKITASKSKDSDESGDNSESQVVLTKIL